MNALGALVKKTVYGINKNTIYGIAYLLFITVALTVKCAYLQFSTGISTKPFNSYGNITMLVSTFGLILSATAFINFVCGRKAPGFLLLFDALLSLVLFADTLYYRYYSNVITIPVLLNIGLVGSTSESARSLTRSFDLLFLFDLPLIIAAAVRLKKARLSDVPQKAYSLGKTAVAAVLMGAGFLMLGYAQDNARTGLFEYDNNSVINNLGIVYFHMYDVDRYVSENILQDRTLTEKEQIKISEFYKSRPDGGKSLTGAARDMNVVVVQVEALQHFIIGKSINNVKITPNIDSLIKESMYFDNIYFQIGGGNTSDAEFLANTSLYPMRDGAVYFRFPANLYPSLPKALKDEGYETSVFHANNPSFWNRAEAYKALGFDSFFSESDFNLDEIIGWGLSDQSFFRQAFDLIDTSNPFYSFFITLSSHHPFSYFDGRVSLDTDEFEGTLLGDYIKAAHYVDEAIGTLIEELKERGLYDNTLLVIYGDHYAVQREHIPLLERFMGYSDSEVEWLKLQRVPLIIRCPSADSGKTISVTGGQIDIFPTVANLMGIDAPYAMGKDLLNTPDGYALLRSGNIASESFYYISATDSVYDISGNRADRSAYAKELIKYKNELSVSDSIILKDAFRKLEVPDKPASGEEE